MPRSEQIGFAKMQYEVNFGTIGKRSATPPGQMFRLAVLGDFSGRASSGILETGTALAARKAHKVDVDNLDALIERLSVTISVPVTEDGGNVSTPIGSMDDFHPDQLVENLPVFQELLQLRRGLQSRAGFERAAKEVLSWAGETALPPATRTAPGTAIATDRKLSDFARLTGRPPTAEVAPKELIRRLVGPFIVPERDSRQDALIARVDTALSESMRRVIHHPNFQTVEALWRGLEFLVRRLETGSHLQIVVYDISAEELAADLAASDVLDSSALYRLLVEQPALDADQGPISMIAGLYQFELSPPHADLLGRIGQIAASCGAPFVGGIGPDGLQTPSRDWHPLIRQAWEALRALPASAYLGLATPRFLLRLPYGKKTDPIDSFEFEEFTRQRGLSAMLWGHPAWLTAYLIAETWRRDPRNMKPGGIATVGDLPVYVYHDADGDQIALPCAERMYSERQAVQVTSTGVNPVLSIRGRPEIRMGGFASLASGTLAGRWAPVVVTPPAPASVNPPVAPTPAASVSAAVRPANNAAPDAAVAPPAPVTPAAAAGQSPEAGADLDALLASLNTPPAGPEAVAPPPAAAEPAASLTVAAETLPAETVPAETGGDDLDALLASLTAAPPPAAENETEADLDALLASLK
jgi:type VI secretion system protein ImpC